MTLFTSVLWRFVRSQRHVSVIANMYKNRLSIHTVGMTQ